jgi:hypothetical protein
MATYSVMTPSLFVGLGARVLTNKLASQPPSIADSFVLGLWQGVGLHYAFSSYPDVAFVLGFGVGAKVLIEFVLLRDAMTTTFVLLGLCSGISCIDALSRFLGSSLPSRHRVESSARTSIRRASTRNRSRTTQNRAQTPRSEVVSVSVLSLDTSSDLIDPKPTMTQLDREVAKLRTRASLADTERRRYKEEKKWALSQGNHARASQISWQIKRYTALMQSFHTEADARIIEGEPLLSR